MFLGSMSSGSFPSIRILQRSSPFELRRYTLRGFLPASSAMASRPMRISPSLPILPTMSEAYDLDIPSASPMPSCVSSNGATFSASMLKNLYLYRCIMVLSDWVSSFMDVHTGGVLKSRAVEHRALKLRAWTENG